MPPRFFSLLIVVFWLATSSWLVRKEVGPNVEAGQPPPFHIDLIDEGPRGEAVAIRWGIYRVQGAGHKRIGRARTWVIYRDHDDTFEFHNEITQLQLANIFTFQVKVPRMDSMYRVNRDGALQELAANVTVSVAGVELYAKITGPVRERRFVPHCVVESQFWGRQEVAVDPVEVSGNGSVLNPMHPVNRLTKLRPGQRWRLPVVDPLFDVVGALVGKLADVPVPNLGPRVLDAEVLAEPQPFVWGNKEYECHVIEYKGDDVSARTWVRRSDGLVLQQEAGRHGNTVILQREFP